MSFLEHIARAKAELDKPPDDPWKRALQRDLPFNVDSISSTALLDLLDVPASTGNARRLARTMRAMGWIALKSRRLTPGGFRDTTIRGWARPIRGAVRRTDLEQGDKVRGSHLHTEVYDRTDEQEEHCHGS